MDDVIACGGSVLREISAALVSDNQVLSKYAELCDYKAASSFSSSDVATCFQFCLLVFGRVRAKDLASKYNANLYRGKNVTTLRAGLAANTSKKKSTKKKKKKKNHDSTEELTEGARNELK